MIFDNLFLLAVVGIVAGAIVVWAATKDID
jgi:hypothetical protein